MKITGVDYERLFSTGSFENERITLHADVANEQLEKRTRRFCEPKSWIYRR